MGKPIINGVSGFAAEFIAIAGAGINIEPEDSDALIDALLELRERPELREQYGQAGRAYVIENFDRDKLATEYLDTLHAVTQQRDTTVCE
jgi:glycosyltransferase involved in cell wall biosynthesis